MTRRFSLIALSALAVTGALAGNALAQSFPTDAAPRCQTEELRVEASAQDPCRSHFAFFGLNGPTVMGDQGATDIETTGSLSQPHASTEARRTRR